MPFNKRREISRKKFENSLIEFITWPMFFVTSKKQVEENQEENELKVHLAQK